MHESENDIILRIARREDVHAQSDLNWDYLFATAYAHGLVPLLHKHLDAAPTHFIARLKRESVANSQTTLHLIGKQLRLYKLFTEHNIPLALFKGPLLSQMAYGELALRQAGDIDVLIDRKNFSQARRLLESLGYQMTPPLTPAQLESHLNSHCELQFMRDEWFTVVDLHWDLAPRSFVFKLSAAEVMSRLQSVSLAGTEVKTFANEDLVLYQAMHGAKHLWRRLEWITSLAETIRATPALNWDLLIERANKARSSRILALGVRLVEKFCDVNIPAEVFANIDAEHAMQRMADDIRQQIFTTFGAADSTETNLYNLRVMDRKRDALVSALRSIFVPTLSDWQALALPTHLHSLYYAYRPLRLSKIYSTAIWRRITRSEKHNA